MSKTPEIFPKLNRGGYTARLRFTDEGRGERYFDTEWSVRRIDATSFSVTGTIDYRGFVNHDSAPIDLQDLSTALRPGDKLVIYPRKWTQHGARDLDGGYIKILNMHFAKEDQFLQINFERA